MYTIKMSARYLLVNIQSYSFTHNHISLGAHTKHRPLYAILLRHILKSILAIELMMKYVLSSRPTSSVRHINEINHKRGLTHFEKMF